MNVTTWQVRNGARGLSCASPCLRLRFEDLATVLCGARAAAPQAFPVPRAPPVQQHSIMGQPYIELRHRAPENRLRLPFSLVAEAPPPARELAAGQPVLLMMQLNQQDQHNLVYAAAQGNDMALPGAEGMEEHLEGVESAVKDLEDVEVKDLVDLNLNLDPEDGKNQSLGRPACPPPGLRCHRCRPYFRFRRGLRCMLLYS